MTRYILAIFLLLPSVVWATPCREVGDLHTFELNVNGPSGAVDADSAPAIRLYENNNDTVVTSTTMSKFDDANTVGFYKYEWTVPSTVGEWTARECAVISGSTICVADKIMVRAVGECGSALTTGVALINDAITSAKIAAGAITSSEAPNLDAAITSRMATFTLPTNFASLSINGNGRVGLNFDNTEGTLQDADIDSLTVLLDFAQTLPSSPTADTVGEGLKDASRLVFTTAGRADSSLRDWLGTVPLSLSSQRVVARAEELDWGGIYNPSSGMSLTGTTINTVTNVTNPVSISPVATVTISSIANNYDISITETGVITESGQFVTANYSTLLQCGSQWRIIIGTVQGATDHIKIDPVYSTNPTGTCNIWASR